MPLCTCLPLTGELVMLIGVFYISDTSMLLLHIGVGYCQLISLAMPVWLTGSYVPVVCGGLLPLVIDEPCDGNDSI